MPERSWWGSREGSALDELADVALTMSPLQLERFAASLDTENLAILEQAMGQRLALGWRADPMAMANHLTRGRTHNRWRYVQLLSQKFRDAVEGRSPRQIWNVPARYGKSTTSSRWGPVWLLDLVPTASIIVTSYADSLADDHAVFVRDTLEEHADVLRTRLRRDRRRADRFVTEEGGGLMAAGIRSGITGFGAGGGGGIVIDDPFKDWIEAHSPTTRTLVWNQYRSVLRLRLDSDDAWIIVVHTRWHDDDLTGRLMTASEDETGDEWELVRLPAIAEPPSSNPLDPEWMRLPDPIGRKPGDVLERERFSLDAVLSRQRALGSYLTAGLEQQRPAPEEGGELKRAWWRLVDQLPPRFDEVISSWDMKLKDKETGDFVVGQVWGRTGSDAWLIEQTRGQYSQLGTKLAIALMAVRHPYVRAHYIENTGNGPEVMAELRKGDATFDVPEDWASRLGMTEAERAAVQRLMRRGMTSLLPVNVKGNKVIRARAESGKLEAGHCHVLDSDLGGLALIEEAASFPNGAHDDMVDSWSQAMSKLLRTQGTARAATGTRPEPRAGQRVATPTAGRLGQMPLRRLGPR